MGSSVVRSGGGLGRKLVRNVEFATAMALTRTALQTREAVLKEVSVKLDAPTRMTSNSVLYNKATRESLVAEVFIRNEATKGTPPAKYLRALVEGGQRRPKRHELALQAAGILPKGKFTVPGDGAKLNQHGNLSAGTYTQILSALRASPDPYQNRTAKSAAKARRRGKASYFVLRQGSARTHGFGAESKPIGIFRRKGIVIEPVLWFVDQPSYAKRLPMFETARRVVNERIGQNFRQALVLALGSMRL